MNAKLTKIDLDAATEEDRSDWDAVRALGDRAIDSAIASDPDAYRVEDRELIGRQGASYRYELYRDQQQQWRWRLVDARGELLAEGARSFASKAKALASIELLREAVLGGRAEAA